MRQQASQSPAHSNRMRSVPNSAIGYCQSYLNHTLDKFQITTLPTNRTAKRATNVIKFNSKPDGLPRPSPRATPAKVVAGQRHTQPSSPVTEVCPASFTPRYLTLSSISSSDSTLQRQPSLLVCVTRGLHRQERQEVLDQSSQAQVLTRNMR